MYVADYISQDLAFYANPTAPAVLEASDGRSPVTTVTEGEMTLREVHREEPLAVELREFALAVRDAGPPPVDPHDAIVALLLARKMVESAQSGRAIAGRDLEAVLA
jgi:predicted dehydrogenase